MENQCLRCENIEFLIRSTLYFNPTPTYTRLLEVLREVVETTRLHLPTVEFVPLYYTYQGSVLAAIEIVYFKNRARDFFCTTSCHFSDGNAANRIVHIPPNLATDFTSATLASVALVLSSGRDANIRSIWKAAIKD